jgi:hypothetical protein
MSALGQKQTFAPQKAMSALPPIADRKSGFLRVIAIKECERSTDITAALN